LCLGWPGTAILPISASLPHSLGWQMHVTVPNYW
jgi:hypothetical protein